MEWSDVRIFLAVIRKGSFGEAARSLGVSHPTVGRRIKALEDEAQQPLFRRTREGLVLTDAGDAVLNLAESMENSALALERRLAGNHQRLEGILRISCAEWFAGYVLAPVLVELTRRHPAVVPEIIASYRLLNLSRRDADVAFRLVPFTEPDIVQRRLMTISYGLYGTPETAQTLHHDPASVGLILMNTAQSHFPDVTWLLDRFPRSRRVFTSTSRAVQAQMCLRGWEWPCYHGHWETPFPGCNVFRLKINCHPERYGSATTRISGIWTACAPCWISPIRCLPTRRREHREPACHFTEHRTKKTCPALVSPRCFVPLASGNVSKHHSFSPLLAITSLYQLKLFLRERDISPVPSSCLFT